MLIIVCVLWGVYFLSFIGDLVFFTVAQYLEDELLILISSGIGLVLIGILIGVGMDLLTIQTCDLDDKVKYYKRMSDYAEDELDEANKECEKLEKKLNKVKDYSEKQNEYELKQKSLEEENEKLRKIILSQNNIDDVELGDKFIDLLTNKKGE